jgi:hypothetical protein
MRATRSAAELLVGSSSAPNLHRPPSAGSNGGRGGAPIRRTSKTHSAFTTGLKKEEFGHALGELGLDWEDTIVTSVRGQALKKGIRPGWKIHMIDGVRVDTSEEIWGRIEAAKWQWRSCTLWFVTDMLAIRAEQAKSRAAKVQAEAERLARLPFEGAHDSRHMEQVKEQFKFNGFVEGAENRAVNLAQLKRTCEWTGNHCHRWRDPKTRQKLHIDTMTLLQMNHWLIKPATLEKDCAFTEMLSKDKQPPAWFVISWWGEKVVDLLKCMEAHMALRKLADTSGFWIGAYANRQHSLNEDFSSGHQKSTYYKALQQANFQVLLALDAKTDFKPPATPLLRLWCDFEALMCVDEPKTELDIASVQGTKAVILTKGLTKDEKDMEALNWGTGYKQKEFRERTFSTDTIEKLLSVMIQKAETAEPDDRERILNYIAGKPAGNPAPEESAEYLKANKRLRAMFALTCWRRIVCVSGDASDDSIKDLQLKVSDCIRNDTWRDTLSLDIAFMNGATEKMGMVMRSMPPNLKGLKLNVGSLNMADEHLVALGSSLPAGLEELELGLSGNTDLSNVGVANFMGNLPPKMFSQSLNLKGTGVSKEFQDKADTLDGIKQAIYDESQKGNLCTTVNLCPNKEVRGRMSYQLERSKCY